MKVTATDERTNIHMSLLIQNDSVDIFWSDVWIRPEEKTDCAIQSGKLEKKRLNKLMDHLLQ